MSDPLIEALGALPHGPEFRFVDRLTRLEPGQYAAGEYTVGHEHPFLRGHFPGEPIFPGVLLLEAAAQLAGIVAQSDPRHPALAGLKLAAVRAVKIHGSAKPGEMIRLEARLTGRMAGLVQAEVSATVGEKLVFQGEVTLGGQPCP